MLTVLQWLLSIICLTIGVLFITLNWLTVYAWLAKRKYSSWIPLIGGLFFAIGLGILPVAAIRSYWWIGFVIDWGSLPALTYTAACFAYYRGKL